MKAFTLVAATAATASAAILNAENMTLWGGNIQQLNRGAMSAMQSNMDSTETDCYKATTNTNLAI